MSAVQRELPVVWNEAGDEGVIIAAFGHFVHIRVVRRDGDGIRELGADLPLASGKLVRNRLGRAIARARRP